ncbi:MAG TPA: PD-(D/E)XK nuclease family protein, partial [Burkholderiales bacterium]|nr:PD-(D/E)XK nuclease family protein [Burkholderiales bacterium]
MQIESRRFPPEIFLQDAARALAEENRKADLSGITVLLPNLHASAEFADELKNAAGLPFLILPRMETLSGFASPHDFLPESLRGARLYLALREKGWFGENDLWHLSSELLGLFEELTRWKVALPEDRDAFYSMLEKAYRSRISEPMRFEAMLIHELWHAMELEGKSEAAAFQLKLSSLAQTASGPLYVLAQDDLTQAEEAFLSSWSERAPVRIFSEERQGFYACLWPEKPEKNLMQRAEDCSFPPLSSLRLYCAKDLEEEAEAAQIRIRQWLTAGKKRIALIALDRLAARRARALLERAEILVSDETGWTLSTTSASTVVIRILDAVSSDFYHEDMLDLLKSPFIFTDWSSEAKREAVHFLEQAIRKHHVVSGLDHYDRLELAPDAKAAVNALRQASKRLSRRSMTLSGWLDALWECMESLGIRAGLEQDMAGESLLEGLSGLRRELSEEKGRFGFRAWRRWLDMQLESMTFRDSSIRSPVVFTHLHATRLRKFDAVVLLGCDAAHLPSESGKTRFFSQAVRAELGLPLKEIERRRQLDDLSGLLSRSGETWASWQAMKKGEPNLLSPFLEELNAFHLHAFRVDLIDRDFSRLVPMMRLEKRRSSIGPTIPPSPSVRKELVPESISASGYNSLLACPYQYYAGRILMLSAMEEAEKVMEKADYGSHLHRILHLFHKRHARITDLSDA